MRRVVLLLLLLPVLATAQGAKLAIIIDDLGYHRSRGEAVIDLPAAVTCAVIPQTPHAQALARRARAAGKEVILHMPMETDGYRTLDEGGLREGMAKADFIATLNAARERIPEATGLNNHMGGVLTADATAMNWLMSHLGEHRMFFVDSRTTPQSVAGDMARHHGVPWAGRDIFLDNERDLAAINEQFNRAIALAQRRGQAIVIGHPYPETIEYLTQVLPLLAQAGIEVVPVSRLLKQPQLAQRQKTEEPAKPAL